MQLGRARYENAGAGAELQCRLLYGKGCEGAAKLDGFEWSLSAKSGHSQNPSLRPASGARHLDADLISPRMLGAINGCVSTGNEFL